MPGVGLSRKQWLKSSQPSINWSNPLTSGLLLCVPGNRLPFVDLVGGRIFTTINNPIPNTPTPYGPGIDVAVAHRGATYALGASDPLRLQPPITIGYAGMTIGVPDTYGELFGVHHNNSDTDPWGSYMVSCPNPASTYRFFTNEGGSGQYRDTNGTSSTSTFGKKSWFGVRTTDGCEIWVNGVRENVRTDLTGAVTYDSTAEVFISEQIVSRATGVVMIMAAIWNRLLSGSEKASFDQDPTQLVN